MSELITTVVYLITFAWAMLASILYFWADEKRRDLATDMNQLLYDDKVSLGDLRRSKHHDALRGEFDE